MDGVDTELFISEVRRYPELWNTAVEEYHDRNKKKEAWVKICREFAPNFDERTDKEKDDLCSAAMKKWRNIKVSYTRSSKKTVSGQGATCKKQYLYARQLSFLDQAGATTETQSSLIDHEEHDNPDESNSANVPAPHTSSDTPAASSQSSSDTADRTPLKRPPLYTDTGRKKKKAALEDALLGFLKTPDPEPNDDRYFFESLLPIVKEFTTDQKLMMRSEVLNLIMKIKSCQFSPPTDFHQPMRYAPQPLNDVPPEMRYSSPIFRELPPFRLPFPITPPLNNPNMFTQYSSDTASNSPSHSSYSTSNSSNGGPPQEHEMEHQ